MKDEEKISEAEAYMWLAIGAGVLLEFAGQVVVVGFLLWLIFW